MEEMKSSGSASGFESYMEQLENMTQQQKGINKGTMQMGQMGMMAQQQMMQGLQGQQQALQKALQELMGDMPGGEIPGSLTKAEKDMEEVINDFKRRQVTRKTMERQQQILSRMLDSQISMTQKDYSEKRKSNSGQEIEYDGPTGLPQDKGQRELFLINAMESALQEEHSREYQEMMKHYFRGFNQVLVNNKLIIILVISTIFGQVPLKPSTLEDLKQKAKNSQKLNDKNKSFEAQIKQAKTLQRSGMLEEAEHLYQQVLIKDAGYTRAFQPLKNY